MNECLTTPQHEKQIGYWVSEKDKCMKWLDWLNEWLRQEKNKETKFAQFDKKTNF